MIVGLDIGGTSTHGVLVDEMGEVVAERVVSTARGDRRLLSSTEDLVRELWALSGRSSADRPIPVGIGVPGRVDPTAGTVELSLNLGVRALALGPALSARLRTAVLVDNDVKVTALGAARVLEAHDQTLTYLNLGTGVAAATVVHGRLLRGRANLAGEVGHLTADPAGQRCACGQRGCVETVLGGRHLTSRLHALGANLTRSEFTRSTDPAVCAERDRAVEVLSRTITTLCLTYDPDRLVVGGGVARHADGLLAATLELLVSQARESPFLQALDAAGRVSMLPASSPVAALGAAWLARAGRPLPGPCERDAHSSAVSVQSAS